MSPCTLCEFDEIPGSDRCLDHANETQLRRAVLLLLNEEEEEETQGFTCPKCGGHYFGTNSSNKDSALWIVHCNDQFLKGCKWDGSHKKYVANNYRAPVKEQDDT